MTATKYDLLSELFDYPGDSYVPQCRQAGLLEFAEEMGAFSPSRIQELFIATFDWDPATTLDIGWHLFGEDYARGEFLVRMRGELRRYGIPESTELPDHLTHVLTLLGRMDAQTAETFAREYVAPSVAKLLAALEQRKSPFVSLVRAVHEALPVKAAIPARKIELPVLVGEE